MLQTAKIANLQRRINLTFAGLDLIVDFRVNSLDRSKWSLSLTEIAPRHDYRNQQGPAASVLAG